MSTKQPIYRVRHMFAYQDQFFGADATSEDVAALPKALLDDKLARGHIVVVGHEPAPKTSAAKEK